jgi:hypothetical protein
MRTIFFTFLSLIIFTINVYSLPLNAHLDPSYNDDRNNFSLDWRLYNIEGLREVKIYYSFTENGPYSRVDYPSANTNLIGSAEFNINNASEHTKIYFYVRIRYRDIDLGGLVYSSSIVEDMTYSVTPEIPITMSATDGTYSDKVVISDYTNGSHHYQLYRSDRSSGGKSFLTSSTINSTYIDTNPTPGTTYYYFVKACNSSNICSDFSSYTTGYASIPTPAIPTTISVTDGVYSDQVDISNYSNGADYYKIYRANSSSGTKTTITGNTTQSTYADTSVTPGTTYYYFVKACNSSNTCSDFSSYTTGYASVPLPADDHGNSISSATLITPNNSISGNIEILGDHDYFGFTLNSESNVTLSTIGSTDTYGTLFNHSGNIILANDDGGENTNFKIQRILPAGTYYLKVNAYSDSNIGSYTIEFSSSTEEIPFGLFPILYYILL